jgi:hypothetical protein
MRPVSSQDMVKPLCDILAQLETKGYQLVYYQSNDFPPVALALDAVALDGGETIDTGKEIPCDTTIYFQKIIALKPPRNSDYIIFSTVICDGIIGKGSERFNQEVDRLNFQDYLGKFVRHYQGDEQAIFSMNNQNDEPTIYNEKDKIPYHLLYVTNHPLSSLTLEVVQSRLEYHAQVKRKATLRLEKLKNFKTS